MHAVLKNNTLYISPELEEIFLFISNIENEISAQLHVKSKLEEMRIKLLKLTEDIVWVLKLLQENNIHYDFKSTKDTLSIFDDFNISQNIRIVMIAIFAFLETIFSFITVYENQITDEKEIIKLTRYWWEKLSKKYLLTDDNEFYCANKERLSQISWGMIRDLRNTLTHFFSVTNDLMLLENGWEKNRDDIEAMIKQSWVIWFWFTPEEWFAWVGGVVKILLSEWTHASLENKEVFKSKMSAVKSVVERHASRLVVTKYNKSV